jgi:hypothetical protein
MKHVVLTATLAALGVLAASGDHVLAQPASGQQDVLRRQIEERFDVRSLPNGVLLLPKAGDRRLRLVEVTDGSIAIDGAPATGAELRNRLGADADLVLRLSYLDADARKQLFAGAATLTPEAAPAPQSEPSVEPSPEPGDRFDRFRDRFDRRRERRLRQDGNDRVKIGGSVSVEEGEMVDGDVVAIGGGARVDGEVTGNAVAIGGRLVLGPHADVNGDAVVIGGGLQRDPGARIGGKIVDMGLFNVDFGGWGRRAFPTRGLWPFGVPFFGAAVGMFALASTLMRIVVLSILTSIVLFVGREYIERVGARAAAEPLKAGAIGLLAQLLFGPLLILTIVVLVITIIGIPLLLLVPFAMLAFGVVLLVGFTAVAYSLGRVTNARFALTHDNPYLTAVTGVLLLVSPVLIARVLGLANWVLFPITGILVFVGLLAEYLAWTVGVGAVALLRFERRSSVLPPAAT